MMNRNAFNVAVLVAAALLLSACNNGGNLTLEPGASRGLSQGSPYVQVNQGGKALIVEQGQSASTGVHGWVSIQAIKSQDMSSNNGTLVILNKSAAFGSH